MLNLTRIRSLAEAIRRHYCESLFLGAHLGSGHQRVLDVGSGAGFPGIPIAILRPDCRVVLAESRHRKAVFLREATRELSNVQVHFGRAEQLAEPFDWIVGRAVRPEAILAIARRLGTHVGLLVGRGEAVSLAAGVEDAARDGEPSAPLSGLSGCELPEDAIPIEGRHPAGRLRPIRKGSAAITVQWEPGVRLPWGERRFMVLGHIVRAEPPARAEQAR